MLKSSGRFSLWLLLIFNFYLIYYYYQHPNEYGSLLLMYWFQSVIIGISSFLVLVANYYFNRKTNDQPRKKESVFLLLFFPVHYGIFHLVYLLFIIVQFKGYTLSVELWLSLFVLLVNETLDFRYKLAAIREGKVASGSVFFLPYLRILPMHLAIMGASFSILGSRGLFLVLKTLADYAMARLTNNIYFKQSAT